MTVAPIALVAALRETSVLFATLIATLLLREPWLAARIAAAVIVLTGALLLRVR
jgi:drug/metabolite transporter (DMT)-like permease